MYQTRIFRAVGIAVTCVGLVVHVGSAQEKSHEQRVELPAAASSLEGTPTVRIDSTAAGTTRHVLNADESSKSRLLVAVANGRFFWTSRDNRLLRLDSSGEFTYLWSEPGQYIRLTRLNDRISYVEHVEQASGSVTWYGELRIVVKK